MPDMICPFCKTTWPEEFKWCMEDGAELEQNLGQYVVEEDDGIPGMDCPECGARIDPRDEFCAGCGIRLQSREEAEAAVSQFSCPSCGGPLNPTDPFCGKCGARVDDGESGTEAAPSAGARGTGLCPNCGMQNAPDDPFCGTCGQQMASDPTPTTPPAAAATPAAQPAVQQNIICPQCSLELPMGTDYCHSCGYQFVQDKDDVDAGRQHAGMGACPNCGMELQPGDVFCGTCGYSMSGQDAAQPAPPEAEAQATSPQAAPAAKQSCPNCGMTTDPGDTLCGTCGYSLQETDEADATDAYETQQAPANDVPDGNCPNCGMATDPGESLCGTCGYELIAATDSAGMESTIPAPAAQEPAPETLAGTCPNCGMDTDPGEPICGTCGTELSETAHDAAPASEHETPTIDFDSPELHVSHAKLTLRCPECGSTQTTRGGAFCESCGAMVGAAADDEPAAEAALYGQGDEGADENMRAGDLADPFAAPPALRDEGLQHPMPSLGDVTGSDLVCPECGIEGYPDMDVCASCGVPLVPQDQLIQTTAETLNTELPPIEEYAAQKPAAPPVPQGPSLADITGDTLICSECGMEAPTGMQEGDGCLGCGGALIKSKQEVAEIQASLTAPPPPPVVEQAPQEELPPPPPMPEAAQPAGDEKICSCCGTPNPPETDFCAVCGVDFE